MEKSNRPQGKLRNVVLGGLSLFVVLADQFSKSWIRTTLAGGQSLFDIGFFRIVHAQNTGAAFGILRDYSAALTVIDFAGIVIILLLVSVWQHRWSFWDNLLVRASLGLILGGTVGNLIDRLRLGHVTDFIDFKVWPAFNIADAAVTIGFILMAYRLLWLVQSARNEA